jgi:hypothetical protein
MTRALELAFARGEIHTESDLNYAVVAHLKQSLRSKTDTSTWVIGTNHSLDGVRPDVCCYFVDGSFAEFMADKEARLVGVFEIKFASDLKGDLKKLTRYQNRRRGLIAWVVYGDHFCENIHAHYCREGLKRQREIDKWVSQRPSHRGQTILECGNLHNSRRLRAYTDSIIAFNDNYWIRDNT